MYLQQPQGIEALNVHHSAEVDEQAESAANRPEQGSDHATEALDGCDRQDSEHECDSDSNTLGKSNRKQHELMYLYKSVLLLKN